MVSQVPCSQLMDSKLSPNNRVLLAPTSTASVTKKLAHIGSAKVWQMKGKTGPAVFWQEARLISSNLVKRMGEQGLAGMLTSACWFWVASSWVQDSLTKAPGEAFQTQVTPSHHQMQNWGKLRRVCNGLYQTAALLQFLLFFAFPDSYSR